jgi:hypothetical protein
MAHQKNAHRFLVAVFLVPIFTGIFHYQFLPNEYYYETRHELLASHEKCQDTGRCADIADVWRDKKTGEEFSRDDFAVHRREEAIRSAVTGFAYGLIGCFAFGYFRRDESEHAFFKYLGMAVCVNLAAVIFNFIMTF